MKKLLCIITLTILFNIVPIKGYCQPGFDDDSLDEPHDVPVDNDIEIILLIALVYGLKVSVVNTKKLTDEPIL